MDKKKKFPKEDVFLFGTCDTKHDLILKYPKYILTYPNTSVHLRT